jgi:hypothetical protein
MVRRKFESFVGNLGGFAPPPEKVNFRHCLLLTIVKKWGGGGAKTFRPCFQRPCISGTLDVKIFPGEHAPRPGH